ncbi:MAG: hypothetical protein QF731_09860 [Verrucomicrobiota bacterium]|nr:hypothetical protein [Verrucomicrobiota bacterium]
MKIQIKKIIHKSVFALALGCLSQNVISEPFHWNSYELKVSPKNVAPLFQLLDETFSIDDKPFKVTLSETIFTDRETTHNLVVSSADVDAISSIMSDEYKAERESFMVRLHQLAEVQSKVTGVRNYTTNIPEDGSDTKKENSFIAFWDMEIKAADAPKFVESFMKIVPKTKDIRTNHILGMGTYQFGRGKTTHYVLHTFESYSDLKNSLDSYMKKGAMAEYFNEIKDISTPAGNTVSKVVKQW